MNKFFMSKMHSDNIIKIHESFYNTLLLCISNNDPKLYFEATYLSEKDKKIYATDGKCIIAVDVPKIIYIKEGYYIPVKGVRDHFLIPANLEIKNQVKYFRDFKKVIPNYKNGKDDFKSITYHDDISKDYKFVFEFIRRVDFSVDLKYLKPLKYLDNFNVQISGVEKPIVFYNDNFVYCFIGMRY